jgi:hypothetical protein
MSSKDKFVIDNKLMLVFRDSLEENQCYWLKKFMQYKERLIPDYSVRGRKTDANHQNTSVAGNSVSLDRGVSKTSCESSACNHVGR